MLPSERSWCLGSPTPGLHIDLLSLRGVDLTSLPLGCLLLPGKGRLVGNENELILRFVPELEERVGVQHPRAKALLGLAGHPLLWFLHLRARGVQRFSLPFLFFLHGSPGLPHNRGINGQGHVLVPFQRPKFGGLRQTYKKWGGGEEKSV